jgi:hypothetical protein
LVNARPSNANAHGPNTTHVVRSCSSNVDFLRHIIDMSAAGVRAARHGTARRNRRNNRGAAGVKRAAASSHKRGRRNESLRVPMKACAFQ